ncbi:hypothetical protein [Primorskyibacter sp. 2E233]|uniref:hypothetical protein n=1 Tax=Primorskyibacter sp. 2E233 TaxID=3413431 RepID=UPI003BF24365
MTRCPRGAAPQNIVPGKTISRVIAGLPGFEQVSARFMFYRLQVQKPPVRQKGKEAQPVIRAACHHENPVFDGHDRDGVDPAKAGVQPVDHMVDRREAARNIQLHHAQR